MGKYELVKDGPKEEVKTEWDNLGQEVEKEKNEIIEHDADYYKNDPKKVGELVSALIAKRGGEKSIKENATWDKEKRAYVDENGVPRDYNHLVSYIRKNLENDTDSITPFIEELRALNNKKESSTEYADKNFISEEKPDNPPHERNEEMHPFLRKALEEKARAEREAEKAKKEQQETEKMRSIAKAEIAAKERAEREKAQAELEGKREKKTEHTEKDAEQPKTKERPSALSVEKTNEQIAKEVEKLTNDLSKVEKFPQLSEIWKKERELLDASSPNVQKVIDYRRAERLVAHYGDLVEKNTDELNSLPKITMPWSEAHKRKKQLKMLIESEKRDLENHRNERDKMLKIQPRDNELTPSEQDSIHNFYELDKGANEMNTYLHMRGVVDENRRLQEWITTRKKLLLIPVKERGLSTSSNKEIEAKIKEWEDQLEKNQKQLTEYKKTHPRFELGYDPNNRYDKPTEQRKAA